MKCIEAQQLVKPYIKKQLSDRELEKFLEHVENCPECQDELEIYFTIYKTLEDTRDEFASERYDFKEKLEQDMKNSRRYLHLRKAYRFFRFAIVLLAEFLLACSVITGIEMMGEEGSQGTTIYRMMYGEHDGRPPLSGKEPELNPEKAIGPSREEETRKQTEAVMPETGKKEKNTVEKQTEAVMPETGKEKKDAEKEQTKAVISETGKEKKDAEKETGDGYEQREDSFD